MHSMGLFFGKSETFIYMFFTTPTSLLDYDVHLQKPCKSLIWRVIFWLRGTKGVADRKWTPHERDDRDKRGASLETKSIEQRGEVTE